MSSYDTMHDTFVDAVWAQNLFKDDYKPAPDYSDAICAAQLLGLRKLLRVDVNFSLLDL